MFGMNCLKGFEVSHTPKWIGLPLDLQVFLEGHLLILVEVSLGLQFLDRGLHQFNIDDILDIPVL